MRIMELFSTREVISRSKAVEVFGWTSGRGLSSVMPGEYKKEWSDFLETLGDHIVFFFTFLLSSLPFVLQFCRVGFNRLCFL